MTKPISYHGDPALKDSTIARAREHLRLDLLQHGATGDVAGGQKGCSVACTVGTYNHGLYPRLLGIPEWLAWLQDRTFESLPRDARGLDTAWTVDLLSAIPVGVDLDRARPLILVRILREVALPAVTTDEWGVRDAINGVCAALESGDEEHLVQARSAAAAARWSAWEHIRQITLDEVARLEPQLVAAQ